MFGPNIEYFYWSTLIILTDPERIQEVVSESHRNSSKFRCLFWENFLFLSLVIWSFSISTEFTIGLLLRFNSDIFLKQNLYILFKEFILLFLKLRVFNSQEELLWKLEICVIKFYPKSNFYKFTNYPFDKGSMLVI